MISSADFFEYHYFCIAIFTLFFKKKIMNECIHINSIQDVIPSADGCEECLKSGDTWVHLRLCLTCGHVGCCDESKNKHATKHFLKTKHPVIRSFEPGESWMYCYIDDLFIE